MISFEELKNAMGDLDEDMVSKLLDELVKSGGAEADKALAACQEGMDIVGSRFEEGEYFVADLIFAGDLMNQAAVVLKPLLAGGAGANVGKMVFCTVKGDIHDIGKNIVKALLEAAGIEVIDLGVDVAPETIVSAVKENGVSVLALSGVLTLAIDTMKDTVEALKASGLRDGVKILIGGAPVTADYCKLVGADDWSLSATNGVSICRKWLAG
jgi:methanogenic corrinoid protein MtbC1